MKGIMANQTPSSRLKKLYNDRPPHDEVSLKDFAVSLANDGTADESNLVHTWFANKARAKGKSEK